MDQELVACLSLLQQPIREFEPISQGCRTGREAWRAILGDGQSVKVRRLISAERAQFVAVLEGTLPHPGFARVLAHRGDVLVEEWIPGQVLREPSPLDLQGAADLLRSLHASQPQVSEPTESHLSGILDKLGRVPEMAGAEGWLRRAAPTTCLWGLIHRDFCGSNLVKDESGQIWSVDNEWLIRGPLEYDLARAVNLWELDDAQASTFLQAYGICEISEYWSACALIESVHNRRKAGYATFQAPLHKLQQFWRTIH